jgi:hypothetical protein
MITLEALLGISALGLTAGSGAIGYLIKQTSRLARLEEHTNSHEKLDDVRFQHMSEAVANCGHSVDKLATKLEDFVDRFGQ